MVELSGAAAWFVLACLVGIGLSLIMTFIRLLMGPVLADRVLALDLVSYQSIALILVYAVYMGQPGFLDVALVLALVSFFGTVALAGYIEYVSNNSEA